MAVPEQIAREDMYIANDIGALPKPITREDKYLYYLCVNGLGGGGSGGDGHAYYEGEYNLIPKVSKQSIETKDKIMRNNVTVAEIPFHEVSNETGKTAIIGGII